jgi:hypothetical protein
VAFNSASFGSSAESFSITPCASIFTRVVERASASRVKTSLECRNLQQEVNKSLRWDSLPTTRRACARDGQ